MPETRWRWRTFEALTLSELYELLRLRQEVFVVEQNCPYLDADGYDSAALHLLGWQEESLVACLRLFPPGVKYPEAAIGRVCTALAVRGQGVGLALMHEGIAEAERRWPSAGIQLSAQYYLLHFYQRLGFTPCSEIYDEDGIPHIAMRRESADPGMLHAQ